MFIQEKGMESVKRWIKDMSNQELITQIRMFESIFEFEKVSDFVLLDEVNELLQFMLEECVERLASILPMSNRGNVNANMQNMTFKEMLQ